MLQAKNETILALIVVTICLAIPMVDMSITAIALPTIKQTTNLNGLPVQWVINSYILSMTTFGVIAGKISDMYNPKNIILFGLYLFMFSCFASFFSNSYIELLIFRGIQGLSGTLIGAPVIKFLSDNIDKKFLGKAMGITSGFASIGLIISPIISGQIIKHLEWHYIFLANTPLIVIGVLCLHKINIKHVHNKNIKIDKIGFISIALFLFCSIFIIMEGSSDIFSTHVKIILITIASISLICFVINEYTNKHPIIKLSLFKNYIFVLACSIVMLAQVQSLSGIFWIMYLQTYLHYSATETSFLILPFYILVSGSGFISGFMINKKGAYVPLVLSSIILLLSYAATLLLLPTKTYFSLTPIIIGASISFSFFLNTIRFITINSVTKLETGLALGALSNLRQIAGTIGLAIFTRVLSSYTEQHHTTSYNTLYDDNFYLGFYKIIEISMATSVVILLLSVTIYLISKKQHINDNQ